MSHVEILNFGTLPASPGAAPVVLSRSKGITQDLVDEVTRLCRGWGQPQVAGEIRPAILSFPLKTRPKWASKGAFAVIKVHGNPDLIFQVAVISTSDYATFGYSPFGVIQAGAFPQWDPAAIPGRRILQPFGGQLPISPPPSPEDVGLVDEALHQILTSHKLHLPIEVATQESDRCLALLIEVLPEALKRQMRFASFAPSPANGYHLAATATADCEFSGWQRLMMTLVGGALPDNQGKYVKLVRDCLAFGDIGVVRNESRRLSLDPKYGAQEKTTEQKGGSSSNQTRPAISTGMATASSTRVNNPRRAKAASPRRKHESHDSGGARSPQLAQLRGRNRQLPGPVVALLVLALSLGGGWVYLEFFHGGGEISWTELVSWPGMNEKSEEVRVNSLLEVANVGAIYNQQLKMVNRAKMIPGLSPESEQVKGLVQLKTKAASPLLDQVDLFVTLAASGIRQGERPDRESARLAALADQGDILDVEMARLELAWHSLSSGINWPDLARLGDPVVIARRDSLKRVDAPSLAAAAVDMGFLKRPDELRLALVQTRGMSRLLVLFSEPNWSPQWEKDLYEAAEKVSPSASSMTRAYRNSAFTMIRLKQAEHHADYAGGAFKDQVKRGTWPTDAVADILPGLRREVLKFNHAETPLLLSATMAMYKCLENPEPMVKELARGQKTMKSLRDNVAYRFDPAVYDDYLERIVHEAALECSLQGTECAHLVGKADSPFRQRWAIHKEERKQQWYSNTLKQFKGSWLATREQLQKLKKQTERGSDWTGVWVDLDRVLKDALVDGTQLASHGGSISSRVGNLERLQQAMTESRPLELGPVTVRLQQDRLDAPEEVFFEFRALPAGLVHRSEPFIIGPAAPAGSGWVGTVIMNAQPKLSPTQSFQGLVRTVSGGRELLRVEYPALQDRVGPGALARPRSGEGGSLSIKTGGRWWRELDLPDLLNTSGPS